MTFYIVRYCDKFGNIQKLNDDNDKCYLLSNYCIILCNLLQDLCKRSIRLRRILQFVQYLNRNSYDFLTNSCKTCYNNAKYLNFLTIFMFLFCKISLNADPYLNCKISAISVKVPEK